MPVLIHIQIFTFALLFGAIAISNLPFSMIRHRAEQAANHHHYYGAAGPVPPTPHRSISNPDQQFWTPHHTLGLDPAQSQGYGGIEGRGSPVKQLQFR